jgi:CBS-domain-containing membrane protein
MKVKDFMKKRVISIRDDASIGQAAALFRKYHIGTLPVINQSGQLVGLVPLRKLLELVMPDFVKLITHFEFVHDFGALELRQADSEQLCQSIHEIMDEPICVEADSGLIRATSLLHHRDLKDLPVVDENNVLVGLASHVDLGIALMSTWDLSTVPDVNEK